MNILKYLFLLLLITKVATAQTPNTWVQKASLPDTSRAFPFSFSIGGKGYLGGGFNNNWQTFLKDFWEYDPTTDLWTRKNDLPFGKRAMGVSFSFNGMGYLGLGQDTLFYDSLHTDLWEYNPISDSWTQKAYFPSDGRIYSTSFVIDSIGYVGTGKNSIGNPLQDFWAYNIKTNNWLQKANFGGTSRIGAVSFASLSTGFMGLGNDLSSSLPNDLWEYNPQSDSWLQKINFPGIARTYSISMCINKKILIGGGNILNSFNLFESAKDFWEYFPQFDSWLQKCDMPQQLSCTNSFSLGNKGYICAGYEIENNKYFKTNYEYTPDTLDYNGIDNPDLKNVSCFTFPNPASEKITFDFNVNSKSENQNDKIEVYNAIGQCILTVTAKVSQGRNTIPVSVSALAAGVYFYKITNDVKGSFVIEK